MSFRIETDRLLIREILPEDAQDMFEMDSDPAVDRFLGNKPKTNIEQILEVIQYIRTQYDDYGIGRWAVEKKDTGEFIGWTGFKFIEGPINKQSLYYDFGYRLKSRHWRQGYGFESGVAALHYGLEQLKLVDVFAMTHVENIASMRTLEKIGFKYIETFNYDGQETPTRDGPEPTTWYKW